MILLTYKKVGGGSTKEENGVNKNQLIEKDSLDGFGKTVWKEELGKFTTKELVTSFVEDGSYLSRFIRVFTGLFLAEIIAENVRRRS